MSLFGFGVGAASNTALLVAGAVAGKGARLIYGRGKDAGYVRVVVLLGISLHRRLDPSDCVARSSPRRRARQGAEIGLWLRLVFWDYGEGLAGQSTLVEREHQLDQHATRCDHACDTERRTKDASTSVDTGSGNRQRHWLGLAGGVSAAMVRGTGWGARGPGRGWGVFFGVLVLICYL